MTRRITISAIIILTAIVSLAIAQQDPKAKPARPKSKDNARVRTRTSLQSRPTRPSTQRPGPGLDRSRMMDMQLKQMEAQLGKKKAEMQKAIAELKTVLAIAQGEKATKTAAALQKIIDNKQAMLDAETKAFEMRTQRLKEQFEKRMQQMAAPPKPKPTGKVEKK